MTLDLFPGWEGGQGSAVPIRRAQRLVQAVHDLHGHPGDVRAATRSLALEARAVGAYSVARVLRWSLEARVNEEWVSRHGWDALHLRLERTADRWLDRLERARLAGWNETRTPTED